MSSHMGVIRMSLIAAVAASLAACGAGEAGVGGGGGNKDAGTGSTTPDAGSGPKTCDVTWPELCNGIDDDCDGAIDEDFDQDQDNYTTCAAVADCNDGDAAIHPNAAELANGVDDNCDGKIDLGAAGVDYDGDGTAFPADCNDDEALVGPEAVDVPGDGTDNDCDGTVDNVIDCEVGINGVTGNDFARAMGICGQFATSAAFLTGGANLSDPASRAIRTRFGDHFNPTAGSRLIQLSSGKALDNHDDPAYAPQGGHAFGTTANHPHWSKPLCGGGTSAPYARDPSGIQFKLKVPMNAKSLSFQINFFSAEYPEYVCTQFNDRFIALMTSNALKPADLPGGAAVNCTTTGTSTTPPECNISFDTNGQPLTINNAFFSVCRSFSGTGEYGQAVNNTCTANSEALLAKTGYDRLDSDNLPTGGGSGWLTTKAPVVPGEEITLRFIILDEGDAAYDSTVLIDGFKWDLQEVTAPETSPIG